MELGNHIYKINTYKMIITNSEQLRDYRVAGELSTKILKELSDMLKVGVVPSTIEDRCWELCKENNVEPAFYGVEMNNSVFPSCLNININDVVLHAIPSKTYKIKEGDIVKLDFGLIYKGLYTDHCYNFIIGKATEEDEKLVKVAKQATETAMMSAVVGKTTGDLGYIMDSIATLSGFDILTNYIGHGLGRSLHEDPPIPAYGEPGKGDKLKEGMVITTECQVVKGTNKTFIDDDEWTVRTKDGENSAMFEYVVIVGKKKPEILTKMQNWSIYK
ncbi:MAG: type I methionyl aminopeptidase [Candidatus Dojkabacteria bacterium]|nr:type I methionyl aminopeptidase [Candidatus Dojkabacteria bacterium]MDQ7020871.1 type I methionyl aminopeptidase [Candidatus Dojkabacteria bacterium]